MYEIGKIIGCGLYSFFFRLKKYPRLGVKIKKVDDKKLLEEEFAKAQILRKLGVSVPRFVGITKVKIPDDFNVTATNYLKSIPNLIGAGMVKWGLVIEIIDNDLRLVSRNKINYYYIKEAIKVKALGINMVDSEPDRNVLWSQRKARLYFIDFDMWDIPYKLLQDKRVVGNTFFARLRKFLSTKLF